MIYIYALLSIFTGISLALRGLKNYRILLSVAITVINGSIFLTTSDLYPESLSPLTAIIIAFISGILTYVLAKLITYAWLYFLQMLLMIALLIISTNRQFLESLSGGIFMAIVFLVPLVGTILLRKHIKTVVIGLMSGFSLGLGSAIISSLLLLGSTELESLNISNLISNIRIPLILLVLITLAGVAFQYLYILKKDPELSKI